GETGIGLGRAALGPQDLEPFGVFDERVEQGGLARPRGPHDNHSGASSAGGVVEKPGQSREFTIPPTHRVRERVIPHGQHPDSVALSITVREDISWRIYRSAVSAVPPRQPLTQWAEVVVRAAGTQGEQRDAEFRELVAGGGR